MAPPLEPEELIRILSEHRYLADAFTFIGNDRTQRAIEVRVLQTLLASERRWVTEAQMDEAVTALGGKRTPYTHLNDLPKAAILRLIGRRQPKRAVYELPITAFTGGETIEPDTPAVKVSLARLAFAAGWTFTFLFLASIAAWDLDVPAALGLSGGLAAVVAGIRERNQYRRARNRRDIGL